MITLRPYQVEAVDAIERDFAAGLRRCGISAATGTGKTVILAHLTRLRVALGQRVLILVHRDELVRQTVEKLLAADRTLNIGVVKARENRASAAIVVASVQTVSRPKRLAMIGRFGLVICDEAHRSMSDQWQRVLGAFPEADIAGFSATWSRADNRQLGSFWQKISFTLDTAWAIEHKFLVRPIGKYIRTDIRLDGVKKTAGDYNDRAMATKLSRESIRDAIVTGYRTFAADRSGVAFCPTVDTAEFFREAFETAGITTGGLYGTTSTEDSHRLHKQHRAGDVQLLFSCTRLSEGWDAPWCSAAIIARPTTHQGLFVQMIGRVLRPHPGKTDAVILDPTGVLFKHDLAGVIDLSTSEQIEREPREFDEDDEREPGEREEFDGIAASVSGFEDVELLARSDVTWLRTERGYRFVYAKGQICFLHSSDGETWHVGLVRADRVDQGRWIGYYLTPESAERVASDWAAHTDRQHTARTGRWRTLTTTSAQLVTAHREGLTHTPTKQGALYDAMATLVASRTLDPVRSWQ